MLKTFVRDPDLGLAGEVRGWTSLEVTLRYNQVGAWTLTGQAAGLITALQTPGAGLIVADLDGVPLLSADGVLISGDVEEDGPRVWSADDASSAWPGTLTLAGGDDLAVVADELAFPDPTHAVSAQTAAAYDARSGVAETVIKAYVSANVGSTRASARGDAAAPDARTVTVASSSGRGSSVSFQARFDPLMDVVRTLAQASSPQLGARVTSSGGALTFDCYEPVDRSGTVVFSRTRRNLRGYSVSRSAPTATHVVVAGSGTGTARAFTERKDSAAAESWRRIIRTFVDQRQTNIAAELQAAGDEELVKGRGSGVLSATAVDTPKMRFGEHFGLGDLVSVELETGAVIVDQVTAAKITVTDAGREPTQLTIGNPDADPQLPEAYKRASAALDQIAALNRRY
jgi:hypothetical protein